MIGAAFTTNIDVIADTRDGGIALYNIGRVIYGDHIPDTGTAGVNLFR
jgi:hypothetical protein